MESKQGLAVSVVVPAYNAAGTLGDAIASLRGQTFADWEAVIVDDGSTDETAAIAARAAAEDPRIRLLSQPNCGASAARNAGIRAATNHWLLFLDADDWLAPTHLEVLTRSLAVDPQLDAVHCGYARVHPSGEKIREDFGPEVDDLFPVLARHPAFAIHACIVRRTLVEAVGAFDTGLTTAEDWDVWQRVARCGARFAAVRDILAFYRIRPDSATSDVIRSLVDGLAVIRRGHQHDSRVPAPCSKHSEGAPPDELPDALFSFLSYWATLLLSRGDDARPLLCHIAGERAPYLSAFSIAYILFDWMPSAIGRSVQAWPELWVALQPQLGAFLAELEAASGASMLAQRVQRQLERLVLQSSSLRAPLTIGRSHGLRIDAARPVADVAVPDQVDRLYCFIYVANEPFQHYEFPAFGVVSGETIVDAIAPDVTRSLLRALSMGALCKPRLWKELSVFTLRKRTVRFAWEILRQRGGSRRTQIARWRREALTHLVRRRAVVRAASTSGRPRTEETRWAAIIVEETARDLNRPCGSPGSSTPATAASAHGPTVDSRTAFWEKVFVLPDPWGYTSGYEQTKYEQTLAMLPPGSLDRVLELACAEGHFTAQLAPRVGSLTAADISFTALQRARERCAGLTNVEFVQLDLMRDAIPGRYDLIICAEVLYFLPDQAALAAVARRLAESLEPNGHLLLVHANILADEFGKPGFEWGHPFGAKVIGEIVVEKAPLQLVKEFRTALYRIQLFQHAARRSMRQQPPQIIESTMIGEMTPQAASLVRWDGRPAPAAAAVTERVPILMYHRIASDGPVGLARYRVSPQQFREQLSYLRANGYYSISLAAWAESITSRRALPGRPIMLTFDDGYRDFLTYAAPLLKIHNLAATVFLVTDAIGTTASWDSMHGEPVPLLSWDKIRDLERDGISFGSHFSRHVPLTGLPMETVVREGAKARATLQRELRDPVPAIAYPYGDYDGAVAHALRSCGYQYGLTGRTAYSHFSDHLMELPRIEVVGSEDVETFAARLERIDG